MPHHDETQLQQPTRPELIEEMLLAITIVVLAVLGGNRVVGVQFLPTGSVPIYRYGLFRLMPTDPIGGGNSYCWSGIGGV